jgi:U3 small nucleolar RNA-associated protein 18
MNRSSTGIINLYDTTSLAQSSSSARRKESSIVTHQPEPLKSLEHLTTGISSLAFHPSGEILVGASNSKQKLLKMVRCRISSWIHL